MGSGSACRPLTAEGPAREAFLESICSSPPRVMVTLPAPPSGPAELGLPCELTLPRELIEALRFTPEQFAQLCAASAARCSGLRLELEEIWAV